MIMNSAHLFND